MCPLCFPPSALPNPAFLYDHSPAHILGRPHVCVARIQLARPLGIGRGLHPVAQLQVGLGPAGQGGRAGGAGGEGLCIMAEKKEGAGEGVPCVSARMGVSFFPLSFFAPSPLTWVYMSTARG